MPGRDARVAWECAGRSRYEVPGEDEPEEEFGQIGLAPYGSTKLPFLIDRSKKQLMLLGLPWV